MRVAPPSSWSYSLELDAESSNIDFLAAEAPPLTMASETFEDRAGILGAAATRNGERIYKRRHRIRASPKAGGGALVVLSKFHELKGDL